MAKSFIHKQINKEDKTMKKARVTVTVNIDFEYDETRHSLYENRPAPLSEIIYDAVELAIDPNMHTIQNGVRLLDYETEIDNYERIYE